MQGNSSLSTYASTSSHAVSGGFAAKTRDELRPHILADLDSQEHCSVEQLLSALLKRCRDLPAPSDPSPPSDHSLPAGPPSTPQMPSTDNSPDGSPSSADTVRQSQCQLLQTCLAEVIPLCEDLELQQQLVAYKNAGKEKSRYSPFVKFANCGLKIVAPLQPAGTRAASELKILFNVNDPKRVTWLERALWAPDVAILPLSSARRIYNDPRGEWDHIVGHYSPTYPNNYQLEWPDLLASVELKWNHNPVRSERPTKYDSKLETRIEPLSTVSNQPGSTDASSSNATNSVETSATSSSSAAPSDSVYNPVKVDGPGTTLGPAQQHKRSGDHLSQNDSGPAPKKSKDAHHDVKTTREDAMVQSAINGAEMLCCSLGRSHSFGLVVIDATIWVWWYDRQGAIQSSGIDFVKNLPHFLVLLFALQRFSIADWGFNEELDPSITARHLQRNQTGDVSPCSAGDAPRGRLGKGGRGSVEGGRRASSTSSRRASSNSSRKTTVHVQTTQTSLQIDPNLRIRYDAPVQEFLHHPFCLQGRSTAVFPVVIEGGDPPQGYVAKLYWPNYHRLKEEEIIAHARNISQDLHDHLPLVLGSRDIDPIGTLRIRQELGIESSRPSRGLRIIIFQSLTPITHLQGDDLVIALVECMRCHHILWNNKIFHQDLSPPNLMFRRKGNRNYGVLNDWDLSHFQGQVESTKDITATVPFMAFGLVKARKAQKAIRLYYFELESFFWITVWIFQAFKDRHFDPMPDVVDWQTSNMAQSIKNRSQFVLYPKEYRPHPEWLPYWDMAQDLTVWVEARFKGYGENETPQKNQELLQSMLGVIAAGFTGEMPTTPAIEGLDM